MPVWLSVEAGLSGGVGQVCLEVGDRFSVDYVLWEEIVDGSEGQ